MVINIRCYGPNIYVMVFHYFLGGKLPLQISSINFKLHNICIFLLVLTTSLFPRIYYLHTIVKLLELHIMFLAFPFSNSYLLRCDYSLHVCMFDNLLVLHSICLLYTLTCLTSCSLYTLHIESTFHLQWAQLHNNTKM
jgi:hypothetical protein